jgi:hypothetical protein
LLCAWSDRGGAGAAMRTLLATAFAQISELQVRKPPPY